MFILKMICDKKRRLILASMISLALSFSISAEEIRDYLSEPGIKPFSSPVENLNESVDPFSGALSINHVDLTLPGNGGLDINITRYYRHHQDPDSWPGFMSMYGMGWTMHFGRIVSPIPNPCSGSPDTTTDNPSFELSDGSRHMLFLNTDGSGDFITHSNWRGQCQNGLITMTSPQGTQYSMHALSDIEVRVNERSYSWYVSHIEDVHGNFIDINYQNASGYLHIDTVSASDGRFIDYSYQNSNGCLRLNRIETNGQTWLYTYDTVSGSSASGYTTYCGYHLSQVQLPNGQTWDYTYYPVDHTPAGGFSLHTMTYPYGAVSEYTYDKVFFDPSPDHTDSQFEKVVVAQKTTSGPAMETGTWSYHYAPSSVPVTIPEVCLISTAYYDKTTVVGPKSVQVFAHKGLWSVLVPDFFGEDYDCVVAWSQVYVGLVKDHDVYEAMAFDDGSLANDIPIEKNKYTWNKRLLSHEKYIHGPGFSWINDETGPPKTYAPVMLTHRFWSDDPNFDAGLGVTYSNHDDYGNPGTVTEGANFMPTERVTERTYFNNTTDWIIGLPDQEITQDITLCQPAGSGASWYVTSCPNQPIDMVVDREYDNNTGDLLSEDRYGVVTSYEYHLSGDLKKVTDDLGSSIEYDNYYRGTAQLETYRDNTFAVLKTIGRIVNDTGTVASITDGRNHTTSFSYDEANRLSGINYPQHAAVQVAWDDGARTRTVTRGGYNQKDSFDGVGRIIQTERYGTSGGSTNTSIVKTTFAYDALGQQTFASYPSSLAGTTTEYDALGRVSKVTHPDSTFKSYTYLLNGNRVHITNERGITNKYLYDRFGPQGESKPIQIVQPGTGVQGDTYTNIIRNRLGQITEIFQGEEQSGGGFLGTIRYYVYDSKNFLIEEHHPEIGGKFLTRDAVGRLRSTQLRFPGIDDSGVTAYSYDGLHRLIAINYPDTTPDIIHGYDGNDNLVSLTRGDTHWDYLYDANNNLEQETLTLTLDTGVERSFSLSYDYDALDHLASITYPDGLFVEYSPDAFGRPSQVSGVAQSVDYHPSGHLAQANLSNGKTYKVELDSRLFPASIRLLTGPQSSTVTSGLSYQYDGTGNVLSISNLTSPADSINSIDYDNSDRLIEAIGPWGVASYEYDSLGNILTRNVGNVNVAFHYDGNRLTYSSLDEERMFGYDRYANIKYDERNVYTYDESSNLIDVRNLIIDHNYVYDGHHQRTVETHYDTETTFYRMYDHAGALRFEKSLESCQSTNYILLGSQTLARYDHIDDETDSDNDGLTNCIEDIYHLDPFNSADAAGDLDGDGLSNGQEVSLGTSPINPDSDDDKLPDGFEHTNGLDPTVAIDLNGLADSDNDGIPNIFEQYLGTNPNDGSDGGSDADGDGYINRVEYLANTDLFDQSDAPIPGELLWSHSMGEVLSSSFISSSVAIDDNGGLYIGSNDGYVYSFNADGTLQWRAQADSGIRATPAIGADSTVYAGSTSGRLYAFDSDGGEKWFDGVSFNRVVSSAAISAQNNVYVGSGTVIKGISGDSPQSPRGQYDIGNNVVQSSPAISADGTVYIGSDDGFIYAFSQMENHVSIFFKWRYRTGGNIISSPAIGADGTIYVGSTDGHLYALYPDGILKWRYRTDSAIVASPVLGADGAIYIGSRDDYLYALNADGTLRWRYETDLDIVAPATIAADGTIYFSSLDNFFYAIHPNGELKWRSATSSPIYSSPAISRDGIIYVGDKDSTLYAFVDKNGGPLLDHWSVFRGNMKRTGQASTAVQGINDSDNDRLPDFYEQQMGLDSQVADSDLDSDLDGHTNLREYVAGTDPQNGLSFPVEGSVLWSAPVDQGSVDDVNLALTTDGMIYIHNVAITPTRNIVKRLNHGGFKNITIDTSINRLVALSSARNLDFGLIWHFNEYFPDERLSGSAIAIASDGTLYFGAERNQSTNNPHLYALNGDGSLKWKYAVEGNIVSAASIDSEDNVYVGTEDGYLYAFSSEGVLQWRFATAGAIRLAPAIGAQGIFYVKSSDGYLYALNSLGDQAWQAYIGNGSDSGPVIGDNGTVYIGSNEGLYAYSAEGIELWHNSEAGIAKTPAVSADGTIYAITLSGALATYSDEGDRLAYNHTGIISAPVIAPDGTIYVATKTSVLAFVSTNGGLANSAWPMIHQNPQHTSRTDAIVLSNNHPTLTNPGDQTHTEGDAVSITVVATDPDGNQITYSATDLPDGLAIDSASGLVSGTAVSEGSYATTLSVSDGRGGIATAAFTWTIEAASTGTGLAQITTPAPNSTLSSDTVTFSWDNVGADQYWLEVGLSLGSSEFGGGDQGTNTSATISGLPTDGSTVYVRLWTIRNGAWESADFQYSTGSTTGLAQVTTPAPNSTLSSDTVTFNWTNVNADQYWLEVGSTLGGGDFSGGDQGINTSATVSGLPTDGSTVYVRLWTIRNGVWESADFQYSTGSATGLAQITTPAPNSTLNSDTVTFNWSNVGADQYWLEVGSTLGGGDYSGGDQGINTSATVSGLPTDGSTVYVRLWTIRNGVWESADFQYSTGSATGLAQITTPAPNSTLDSATVTFNWSDVGADQYWLEVGASLGSSEYGGGDQGTSTSATITGLPTDGSTVYVRLWTIRNGVWESEDFQFTAVTSGAFYPQPLDIQRYANAFNLGCYSAHHFRGGRQLAATRIMNNSCQWLVDKV